MWRGVVSALGSGACFAAVLVALVWTDPRVADRLSLAARNTSDHWLDRARGIAEVLLLVARDRSLEHAPLLVFTLAAAFLVLLMVRT